MKIYLDNCCYNRPYDDQTQLRISLETQAKLYVQDLIKRHQVELVSSYVLWYENSQNPYLMRKKAISDFVQKNVSEYIDIDSEKVIGQKVREIMQTGVKMKDAQHVACAIAASCVYFLTTDVRLLKYQTDEIKLVNPIEFVSELEEG